MSDQAQPKIWMNLQGKIYTNFNIYKLQLKFYWCKTILTLPLLVVSTLLIIYYQATPHVSSLYPLILSWTNHAEYVQLTSSMNNDAHAAPVLHLLMRLDNDTHN